METYVLAKNKGVEGDLPLPAEFARVIDFWKTMLAVGVIATVLGLGALLFLNVADFVSGVLWFKCLYIFIFVIYEMKLNRFQSCGRITSMPHLKIHISVVIHVMQKMDVCVRNIIIVNSTVGSCIGLV